jgi:hypothetical protein
MALLAMQSNRPVTALPGFAPFAAGLAMLGLLGCVRLLTMKSSDKPPAVPHPEEPAKAGRLDR